MSFWNLNNYFWNFNRYTQQHNIKGYCIWKSTHLIELSDGHIALSNKEHPYPIVIIDSSSFQVKKEIKLEGNITHCSSLCEYNERSFIFAYKGTFLQITRDNYSIVFQSKDGNFNGYQGIIRTKGKYFAIENGKYITIVKPGYK